MNYILPIILILASVGVFFGYVDPNYKRGTPSNPSDYSTYSILSLRDELKKYGNIVANSNAIVAKREELTNKRNAITEADQLRLARFLPSNIDNIRLIVEISKIVEGRGLVAKGITVSGFSEESGATSIGPSSTYGTLSVNFSVSASYTNFLSLLDDLQNNLRLLDVTSISFASSNTGFYDFSVGMNTYWLK